MCTSESPEQMLRTENMALRGFVRRLGIDPDALVHQLTDSADAVCKSLALQALRLERDFSSTTLTEAGVRASNAWLDSLAKKD